MAGKLYPPTIGGTLPAFYAENGTAEIAVPFSMSRAVGNGEIAKFRIKIKTVQSNTLLDTIDTVRLTVKSLNERIAYFSWNVPTGKVKIGQFLKIQMAYVDTQGTPGYYSTVGIAKYTTKPTVYIEGASENISAFPSTFVGVFEPGEDKSEKPYSYKFTLYQGTEQKEIESSGWLLHNSNQEEYADIYNFKVVPQENMPYYVKYYVRTINNLEICTDNYAYQNSYSPLQNLNLGIKAENNFEEGYVKLTMFKKDANGEIPPGRHSIEIYRTELKRTNLNEMSWQLLARVMVSNLDSEFSINSWNFKDFTIEQGIYYKYSFREYNSSNVYTGYEESNVVYADFEDMFLCDVNHRQVKVRFNPKVSSFKTTRMEQKVDTIGSKYPYFFRNGVVGYKEFPISGLISYKSDNNEMFVNYEEDLNILKGSAASRSRTPTGKEVWSETTVTAATYEPFKYYDYNYKLITAPTFGLAFPQLGEESVQVYTRSFEFADNNYELMETLDSVGYNLQAERRFKLALLDWLGNGEVKLFKSPTEGNYLVRLLNISLTPEDRLGRMLHTFTCTAYEVADFSYENLLNLNFFKPEDFYDTSIKYKTVKLKDLVDDNTQLQDNIVFNGTDNMYQQWIIELSDPNAEVWLWIDGQKTLVTYPGLTMFANKQYLNSIVYIPEDNVAFSPQGSQESAKLITLGLGDIQLTYSYVATSLDISETVGADNILKVELQNKIETIVGEKTITFYSSENIEYGDLEAIKTQLPIQFFVLQFEKKHIIETNDTNYDSFNSLYIYKVFQDGVLQGYWINGTQRETLDGVYSCTCHGGNQEEDESFSIDNDDPFSLKTDKVYQSIEVGAGVILQCAYQLQTIITKDVQGGS